jgi:ribosomal protein L17
MPKYYGATEIDHVNIVAEGSELVMKDGTKTILSPKMAAAVITNEPIDLTTLREKRLHPVVEAILSLLLEWDVKINEIEYIYTLVTTSFNENYKAASDKAWGIAEADRKVSDVDRVLKTIK